MASGLRFAAVAGLLVGLWALTGCRQGEPGKGAGEGTFSVAFVYVGPVGDGGWTWAHDEGRRFLEQDPTIRTAYLENVAEGADAEQAIRSLARKEHDLIVTTSFGFMDATQAVAAEFPATSFLHISGFRKNDKNFANLMGAMESVRYLAGIIAGARAREDGATIIGAVEPFPIAEVLRLLNAFALGIERSCPDCRVHIRWTNSWFDPVKEKEAAQSLLEAGAQVIATGCDTPGPVAAAAAAGKWGIGYDSRNACGAAPERCLTTTYWNWGPVYADIVRQIRAGSWVPSDLYPDVPSGIVGLLGFEEGEQPAAGVPAAAVAEVRELYGRMKRGEMTRFDIFTGPLVDNQGREVAPAGARLTQEDLEGLSGLPDRPDCKVCMRWLNRNIVGVAK